MSDLLDARIDGLYRVVKGRIDWNNLIPTCLEIAHELEQIPGIKGPERLDLLQKTLRFAVKESDRNTIQKEEILHYIDTIVPLVMQAAVLASKVPIREIQAGCFACWKKVIS